MDVDTLRGLVCSLAEAWGNSQRIIDGEWSRVLNTAEVRADAREEASKLTEDAELRDLVAEAYRRGYQTR